MSIDSSISDLHKAHTAGQEKYTYFLLAAAGAAIGFAVQKVDGMRISWWLLPVALSIALWGLSFYCGCKNVHWVSASMSANTALLDLRRGTHVNQPDHPQARAAAERGVMTALKGNISRAAGYSVWQFRLLIAGAVLFISWRVTEMVRISYPQLS